VGWELSPEAIYPTLLQLKRYNKPIYITENGVADALDENRAWFIFEILCNVAKAIGEGIDVRGYLHWSLMDNFEWEKGFWPRFGLLEVDYENLRRVPRPSAYFYSDVCVANGITDGIVAKHQNLLQIASTVG
jgi:beta-glucosidase